MNQLAITATFTAEPIERSLGFWLHEAGLLHEIKFAPYNQVFQQLLDPTSLVSLNQRGANVILLRFEDLMKDSEEITDLAKTLDAFAEAAGQIQAPTIISVCPASPDVAREQTKSAQFAELEEQLVSKLASFPTITTMTSSSVIATYPVEEYYDSFADHSGHVPYTADFFAALSAAIVRKLHTIQRVPYKVIVLDCDNTLWEGVCGEDGVDGITPYHELQEFMVAQYRAGMLLCLCSKNSEEDALDVFRKRTEMPLHLDHFVAWKINWEAKSQNILQLAQELQLGLDSFIFLDDNPLECAEVRANCPDVLTLQLPTNTEYMQGFLAHAWPFDRIGGATVEDQSRTQKYRENVEREKIRGHASSLNDFLDKLELKVHIAPVEAQQIPRVSQMTQRTNQFNFTTKRYSEAEILQIHQSATKECLVADVSDRFGDYGLVGAMIFDTSTNVIEVDTFLLSCRALGRKVEERLVSRLGEIAIERNLSHINMHFMPTKKNRPAFDFLTRVAEKFKEETADGFLYRVPSRYAENLAHAQEFETVQSSVSNSKNVPDTAISSAKNSTDSEHRDSSKSAQFQRIATELQDPAAVQRLIQAELQQRPELMQAYVAPQSETETTIARIWQDVLYIDRIGIDDRFIDLGGGSLQLVQVYSKLKNSLAPDLAVTSLFNLPTISALTDHIHQQKSVDATKGQIQDRAKRQQQALARRKLARKKAVR